MYLQAWMDNIITNHEAYWPTLNVATDKGQNANSKNLEAPN